MANQSHVEIARKGTASIAEWRKKNPKVRLDLSGANLSHIELSRADLSDADLSGVDLSEALMAWAILNSANLSGASLSKTNLGFCCLVAANLSKADFSEAKLFEANLTAANLTQASFRNSNLNYALLKFPTLSETDLTRANLTCTVFYSCNFADVNVTQATMHHTVISDSMLFGGKGLETVNHTGPSYVDISTLLDSFSVAGGCLPPNLETFLLGIGVPKQLLDGMPQVAVEIKYCSCFVAYGEPDKFYAERLKKDFVAKGLSCWVYSLDSTPGERTWPEISRRRREAEKMIVLCSAKSLVRSGVLKEIEEQIDENPDKLVPISLDDTWKAAGFPVRRGARDLKPFLLERNYADFSDEKKYKQEFERLLRGLKKSEG